MKADTQQQQQLTVDDASQSPGYVRLSHDLRLSVSFRVIPTENRNRAKNSVAFRLQ